MSETKCTSHLLALFSLLLLNMCGTVTAFSYCCNPFCGCEVGAELLILRPSTCDQLYAILDSRSFATFGERADETSRALPIGDKQEVESSYAPGFRFWLGQISYCHQFNLIASYSRLHTTDTRMVTPEGLGSIWPTFASPNNLEGMLWNPLPGPSGQLPAFARARSRFDYDAGDLELGMRYLKDCTLWIRGFLGIHFANIEHYFAATYQGTIFPGNGVIQPGDAQASSIFSSRNSNTWLLGPQIGFELNYATFCNLGIAAQFVTGWLVGGVKTSRFEQMNVSPLALTLALPVDETLDIDSRRGSLTAPFIGSRLGLTYFLCCGCQGQFVAQFGYAFRTYFGVIQSEIFTGTRATSHEHCENFSYDGFYLSLALET